MKTLADRLKLAMERAGMRQADLARAVGISRGAVSFWLSGSTRELSSDNLLAAAQALRVRPEWLASGKLPMVEDDDVGLSGFPLLDIQTDIVTISRYETGGSMGDGVVLHDQPGVIESWRVSKQWLAENVRGYTSAANLAIVTGFGDSMRPTYNPGDPLIVDTGVKSVEFDSVYFFRVGNDGYIKRLQRVPTARGLILRAISDNPVYPPFEIDHTMDFEVLARVVQVWRREDY